MELQHVKAELDAFACRVIRVHTRSAASGCCDISTYVHANHGVSRRVSDGSGGYGLQIHAIAARSRLCLGFRYRPGRVGSGGIWTGRASDPIALGMEAYLGWIWKTCWFPIHASAGQGCGTIPLWINSE